MLTHGNGRGRAPSLLLTILFCCALAVGLGAAAPVFALTLSGTVANDVNGNGVLDLTDTPLGGISVTVTPAAGGVAATTTTTANGTYSFPGLAANTYTVTLGTAPGLINGTPGSVTVTLNTDLSGVDFLFVVPGLIGGRVIADLNGNGIAEPTEPGLSGVAVDLNRTDKLGQSTLVTTVSTSADGTFFFPIEPAGTYTVVAHPAAGAMATGANVGSSGTATVLDPNTIGVVLNGGQSAVGLRFAERTPPTAGISGFVLDNTNKPLPNVVVELRDASQNLLDSTLTDANGQYSFVSVAPGGTYVMRVVPPPGFTLKQVSPTAPATATGTSGIQITNFSPGTIYANNNFVLGASAVVSPATPGAANAISGVVINDLNGNGVFNAGEPGLAGATLTLVATTGVSFGTTVTGASGDFTFVNLPAGDYLLTRTNPLGYVSTGVQPGVGGTSVSLDTIRVSVTGDHNLFSGHIFLARATVVSASVGTISGSVIDLGTGRPIPGVTIQLFTQLNNTFVGQTTTDASGAYTFTNEPPGSYLVVQGFRSDLVPVSATTLAVTVVAGVNSANNNFLDRVTPQLSTISGSVILDVDHNGVIDVPPAGPDVPIPGVRVVLQPLSGAPQQTFFTDVNGAYAFSGLAAGTYNVVQVVPHIYAAITAIPGLGGVFVSTTTIQVTVTGNVSGSNNFLDAAAVVSPTVGSISGSVINQATGLGIPGVTIQLLTQLNVPVGQTTTDANGMYTFTNEPPGSYRVVQGFRSDLVPVSLTSLPVTVVAGANQGNINFVDRSVGPSTGTNTISGFALRDVALNGNPNRDQGLAGMVIVLRPSFGNLSVSQTTNSTGAFSFPNLAPGTYTLTATPPRGLTSTNAIAGQGGTPRSVNSISVTTTPGITDYPGQLFLAGP